MTQTISALAGSLGVSADALRYYERIGLLRPPARSPAGYRVYDDEATERLRFIKGLQRTGLRLGDVKELLDVRDRGQCPCGHTQLLVHRRLAEVQAEIAELEAHRDQLLDLQERNEACFEGADTAWCCSAAITGGGKP
jgi:DNA-binding transcriptional MerR regulator